MGRTRRVTLADAAQLLGISKEAIRKRVSRGTLPSDVGEDGRRYVYLDAGEDAGQEEARSFASASGAGDPRDELIATLKEQLDAERNAHAETRRIAYTLAQRIPELTAPEEARTETAPEATRRHETASEESYGTSPQEAEDSLQRRSGGAGDPSERSWWRRFFGVE